MTEHLAASDIARAASLLRAGELVAFPTETVYGLGGDLAAAGDHPLVRLRHAHEMSSAAYL